MLLEQWADDGGDDVEVGTLVLAELRTSADLRRAALKLLRRHDGRGAKAHEGARLFYVDERDATKRLHPRSAAASWKKATAITIQIPVVSPAPKRRLVGYDVSPRVARR